MAVSCRSTSPIPGDLVEVDDPAAEEGSPSLDKKIKEDGRRASRLREDHSEAIAEATHFRNLHVKGIMKYSRRKADFAKELEECKKSASDRI